MRMSRRIRLPDGNQRQIDVIKSAVRDANNNITGVQIIFRDVTEELQLEAALKKSEQRLQAVLDNAAAVIYIKDTEGKYLLINREFESLFDTSLAEVVGKTDYDLFPAQFADAFKKVDQQVIQRGESVETEEIAPQSDGPHTYITSKFPLRNEQGAVYAVAGISTDITRRKRTEEALRESEERARRIVETANDAFISIDAAGIITDWNAQAERTFGWSRAEAVGKSLTETIIPPEFHQGHDEGMQRFLDTGEAKILNKRIEIVARHRSGRQSPVELTVWPLVSGDTYQFNAFVHDITERKEAEQRLKSTNRELEEFAYVVSHDLQEPLRTLQFFSDSLQVDLGETLDEQPRRDLQFITEAAGRMQQLVRDLLALSRTGRAEMQRGSVSLNGCVDDAMKALSNRIRQSHARIDVAEMPDVQGDRTLLTQLFQNLIGNALKFVEDGKTPRVHINSTLRDGACVVCVADNGIGIKTEYAKKIFAPFQRLHASSEYEGTGIGLAICRKVVQRHGGKIWVDSAPSDGTQFQVELPLAGRTPSP